MTDAHPSQHRYLVERTRRWLSTQGCKIVLTEFVANSTEIPDAIGWHSCGSLLIECKTSRSDFLADRKKPHRMADRDGIGTTGLGDYRYFMCYPGVIRTKDLPPGWGLLYVHKRGCTIEEGNDPKCWARDRYYRFTNDRNREHALLLSALNRLRLHHGDADFRERVHATFASKNPPRTP